MNDIKTLQSFYDNILSKRRYKIIQDYLFCVTIDFNDKKCDMSKFFVKTGFDQAHKMLAVDGELPSIVNSLDTARNVNHMGYINLPQKYAVVPTESSLSLSFLNTEFSIHEIMFAAWMTSATNNYWDSSGVPFSKAKITVDFIKQDLDIQVNSDNVKSLGNDIFYMSYYYYDCYPTDVQMIKPDYKANVSIKRNVKFNFDYMDIKPTTKQ